MLHFMLSTNDAWRLEAVSLVISIIKGERAVAIVTTCFAYRATLKLVRS